MTFLSQATPIARRFEIWVPTRANGTVTVRRLQQNADLASLYTSKTIRRAKAHRRRLGDGHAAINI
jgi:hypothetical protein